MNDGLPRTGSGPTRRTYLKALSGAALLPLAGCVLEPPAPTVQPISCPPLPSGHSADTVGAAVADFEYAYLWNFALSEFGDDELTDPDFEVTEISVEVPEPVVEPVDEGYLVFLDPVAVTLHFERGRGSGQFDADLVSSYFVSETDCLRVADETRTDPRTHEHGRTPVCRV